MLRAARRGPYIEDKIQITISVSARCRILLLAILLFLGKQIENILNKFIYVL